MGQCAERGSRAVLDLEPPVILRPGDLNCDGAIDFGDINPFVLALTDPPGYGNAYPGCNLLNGDINSDGTVDFGDINPFVNCLTTGQCP